MSDWKKDLENKAKQLNLTEGGSDGQAAVIPICTDRGGSSRSDNSISSSKDTSNSSNTSSDRSRDLFRRRIPEKTGQINNVKEKGGVRVITKDAAIEDLDNIDINASVSKVIIEVGRILIKLLATIRSNQLLTETEKVKIREARKARDTKQETK